MIATRSLHTPRQALVRAQYQSMLAASDVVAAVLIGAVLWNTLTPLNAGVWVLGSLSAWALTGQPRHPLRKDSYVRALAAPVLAFLVCLVLGALRGVMGQVQGPPPLVSLLMASLWMVSMVLCRVRARAAAPAFIFGVVPGAGEGLRDGRVKFVELRLDCPDQLDDLDGLLVHPGHSAAGWTDTVAHAFSAGVPVWTRAQLLEELHGKVPLEQLRAERLKVSRHQSNYLQAKRFFDVTATLLAAPLLAVLMLLVAVLVLLDAGAPVLFFQRRVGQNGQVFTIAKFRTMRRDSESQGEAQASSSDARVTRVGRLLRKFRLDELPQFWNVLRGEMSVIGPRPEQEGFVQAYEQGIQLYATRHRVRPGITGWAQVRQGYAAGEDETLEKLRHDVYYIKHFSLGLDFQVVLLTVWTVLTGFGSR